MSRKKSHIKNFSESDQIRISIMAGKLGIILPCDSELFHKRMMSLDPDMRRKVKRKYRKIIRKITAQFPGTRLSPENLKTRINSYILVIVRSRAEACWRR